MSQHVFSPADALALYPDAQYARTYTYPSIGITGLGVAEWGQSRRSYAHYHLGRWCCGYPSRMPDMRYPLYKSDEWTTPLVVLVASEREAFGLEKIGVNATTWIGHRIHDARWSDWSSLDGFDVRVWLPESYHQAISAHLWRHQFVPDIGSPLDWLRSAWERHSGDTEAIREELLWMKGM